MRYLVTNFAYGYGPFLRTTELALEVNALLAERSEEPFGIIVPWVYGEKQKQIMLEEFSEYAHLIFLDAELGAILKKVFYADSTYEEALAAWVEGYESISAEAEAHLSKTIEVETLAGETSTIERSSIDFVIARAPRISYGSLPCYGATFGHISEILKAIEGVSEKEISVDRDLVRKAIPIAEAAERTQKMIGLAHPGTFSYVEGRKRLPNETPIPPTIRAPHTSEEKLADGIYVTITGIPGLERLYAEAQKLGLIIYTNDPKRLEGSVKATPDVIGNEAIKLHFARSGWGSVWGSQLLNKAIIVPEFDPADDPEIYFNNICVEKLGLGIVYRGESIEELLVKAQALEPGIKALNEKLVKEFGTREGNRVMAQKILEDWK